MRLQRDAVSDRVPGRWTCPTWLPSRRRLSVTAASACSLWERWNTGRTFLLVTWTSAMVFVLVTPAHPVAVDAQPGPEMHPVGDVRTIVESTGTETGEDVDPTRTFRPAIADYVRLSACWGTSRMQVGEALETAGLLREVVVAVLDTGIDTTDRRIGDRTDGSEVVVEGAKPEDVCGHGTRVAGTILTIAPNSRVLSIKVADDRGHCTTSDVAAGIRLAANAGAAVINLSLVCESSDKLQAAVEHAWRKGAVLVAAAGMPQTQTAGTVSVCGDCAISGDSYQPLMSPPVFPAAYPHVLAVTGTNTRDEMAPVSNRADWVDVAAPGHRTCLGEREAGYLTGTSMAAAHISGVAAIMCGVAVDQSGDARVNDEVREAIERTAEPMAMEGTGYGIVNARTAVDFLLSTGR